MQSIIQPRFMFSKRILINQSRDSQTFNEMNHYFKSSRSLTDAVDSIYSESYDVVKNRKELKGITDKLNFDKEFVDDIVDARVSTWLKMYAGVRKSKPTRYKEKKQLKIYEPAITLDYADDVDKESLSFNIQKFNESNIVLSSSYLLDTQHRFTRSMSLYNDGMNIFATSSDPAIPTAKYYLNEDHHAIRQMLLNTLRANNIQNLIILSKFDDNFLFSNDFAQSHINIQFIDKSNMRVLSDSSFEDNQSPLWREKLTPLSKFSFENNLLYQILVAYNTSAMSEPSSYMNDVIKQHSEF